MPLIVPVMDIRESMALDDVAGVSTAIERAIETAQTIVSSSFRSEFDRVTVVDDYFVKYSHKFGSAYKTLFLLSRGLVDTGSNFTIYASAQKKDLTDSTVRVDLEDVESVDYTSLDSDKGLLEVFDYDLTQCYVRISYTAGLLDDLGDPAYYLNVPRWLYDAVKINTQIALDSNPIIPRPTARESQGTVDTNYLQRQSAQILLSKSRYAPAAWKPTVKTITPV